MIKVVVADDHQMLIDGIKSLLAKEKDIKVIGEALNGKEVISLLERVTPDLVLLDINMPEMDGLETTKLMRLRFPDVKILMLTMHNNSEFIFGLMNAGASGYILKNTGRTELIDAIKTIHAGKTYYSKEVTDTILQSVVKKPTTQKANSIHLTDREKEVLKLIAQEFSSLEIANKLFISANTVETHRKNLMSKLGTKNLAGLVKYALQEGLID